MHTFIRHGYAEGVAHLTQSHKDLVIAKSERGRCALHIAVLFANLEIIGTLINANPKAVNTPDNVCLIKLQSIPFIVNSKVFACAGYSL